MADDGTGAKVGRGRGLEALWAGGPQRIRGAFRGDMRPCKVVLRALEALEALSGPAS